ncbi:MAG: hypothetical protein ACJ8JD_12110 [Chthoniobacterales bacterium]|jgi:hypothetical protein
MGIWNRRGRAIGAAIFALSISPALATVVWQLNPNNQNQPANSTTESYTVSGRTITATGYDNHNGIGTATELYFKNVGPINGAFETGLGVNNTADHELQAGSSTSNPFDFIQLNLTSIVQAGAANGKVMVTSVQSGEAFTIFGSNTAGTLGTQLGGTFGSSSDSTFVNLPNFGQYDYYSIAAADGDVIIKTVSADFPAVPEMNALFPITALMAAIAAAELIRRRRLAQS